MISNKIDTQMNEVCVYINVRFDDYEMQLKDLKKCFDEV
jgi:hypothetical protein